jgi:uncharacterized membrane protein
LRTFHWRRVRVASALTAASIMFAAVAGPVAADDGLEVRTPFPAVVIAPGSQVSFELTVSSVREADVALRLDGVPEGWSADLLGGGNVVDGVLVTPDAPGEVRLDVDVPADATATTARMTLTAEGGGATDVLPLSVRVDAEAAGDIALTTSTPALTGSSDADFSFDLEFRNDTAQDVTLAVRAAGPDGWDVTAELTGETQAASTVVEAGSTQNVTVTATPPADVAAGTYPIAVEATAGERTVTSELAIEVTGSYALELGTPDDRLSAAGSAGGATTQDLVITNTGTAPITEVSLEATSPTNWEVTFEPQSVLVIEPGASETITATITPSGEAVAGDYEVVFSASAAEAAATDEAAFRFTVETSPLWALVGLGIIGLILLGLFYVFRTYGRR